MGNLGIMASAIKRAPPATYREAVLADSPPAYFRLGEPSGTNAADASTTNNAGTYTNTPTLAVAGPLVGDADTAVTFLGTSSQYVLVPNNAAYNVGTGNYSIELWFKTTSRSVMFLIHYAEGETGWEVYWNGDHLDSRVGGLGSTEVLSGGVAGLYADGAWHHAVVAMTRGTTGQWYVDGAASGSAVDISGSSAFNITGTGTLNLARRSSGTYFTGSLDEVAFYGSALSPARVLAHYHAAGY